MLSELDRALLLKLIAFRSSGKPFQEFFSYVLEADPDLKVVGKVVHAIKIQDLATLKWLKQSCLVKRVDEVEFVEKINQLLTNYTSIPAQIRKQYQVLQLSPWASKDEIKRQYRKLAHQYHPDTSAGEGGGKTEQFVELSQAYHNLLERKENDFIIIPPIYPHETVSTGPENPVKNPAVQRVRRKNMIWYLTACVFLFVLAVVSDKAYQNAVMMRQLTPAHTVVQKKNTDQPPEHSPASTLSENKSTTKKLDLVESTTLPLKPSDQDTDIPVANQPSAKETDEVAIVNMQQSVDQNEATCKEKVQQAEVTTKISGHDSILTVSNQEEIDDLRKGIAPSVHVKVSDKSPVASISDFSEGVHNQADELKSDAQQITQIKPTNYIAIKESRSVGEVSQNGATPKNHDAPARNEGSAATIEGDIEKNTALQSATGANQDSYKKESFVDEQAVRSFVDRYVLGYNSRSLSAFKYFFASDARENGKLVVERWPSYVQLFNESETLMLDYKISRVEIQSAGAYVSGTFTLHRSYPDGRKLTGNGLMGIHVVSVDTSLLVKNLEYSFFTSDQSL
ncbi:MAG: J domain-containing protein [bacterium]|nr:J domain-containing protein [bacterium]